MFSSRPRELERTVEQKILLRTALPNGTSVPTLMPDGSQAVAVDNPHYLGRSSRRPRTSRSELYFIICFHRDGGELFLPSDSTVMGSGMGPMEGGDPMDMGTVFDMVRNPMCSAAGKSADHCFRDNRATLHLHGGTTPWISDGTPHQWITPANETTPWPEGVSVKSVRT